MKSTDTAGRSLRAMALATFVLLASIAVPSSADESKVLARYAVLLGDRVSTSPPPTESMPDDATAELLTWDYRRDNAELERLFNLERVHTLQLGSARLAESGGRFSATSMVDDQELKVRVRVAIRPFEDQADPTIDRAVSFNLEVWLGDELISAPSIISVIGQRAIVSSGISDEPRILWIIVQLDDLPLTDG